MERQKRSIQRYWDWRSLSYPRDADKSESIAETWETLLAGLVSGAPGKRAIDMGTGTGQFAVHLARLGFCVTGIDISGRMEPFTRLCRHYPKPGTWTHHPGISSDEP